MKNKNTTIDDIMKIINENTISYEPKTTSRFIACTKNKSGETFIPTSLIVGIDRPSFSVQNKKTSWNPMEIKLYDPIVPSTSQILYPYLKSPFVFDMNIIVLGPVGDAVEEWEITNSKIVAVDFGKLDWRTNAIEYGKSSFHYLNLINKFTGSPPIIIAATIKYDFATLLY